MLDKDKIGEMYFIKIALVDDNVSLRSLLSKYLKSHGFDVVMEACNGKEFIDQLEVCELFPEVCLMDAHMPQMDGFATAQVVKNRFPSIGIMGFSFCDDPQVPVKFMHAGAQSFLCKDADPGEIREAIVALVEKMKP